MREIAQLLLPSVRAHPALGFAPAARAIERAAAAGVGGFVVENGTRSAVAEIATVIRHQSADAPIVAIGPDTLSAAGWCARPPSLPPLAAIASLREPITTRRIGRIIARETLRAGCNALLAPSCDVARSSIVDAFSSEASDVAESASEWIDAAQAAGVLCFAGRFPGGGAVAETIEGPPVVRESDDALYARDLVPFRAAIDTGVAGLVLSEAVYPSLDAGVPAARSPLVVKRLLRSQLGFDGLAVADAAALGRSARAPVSPVDLIGAGIDIILRPSALDADLRALTDAVRDRLIDRERVHDAAQRRRHRAEMAAGPLDPPNEDGDDATWLDEVAERVVVVIRGRSVRLAAPIELAMAGTGDAAAMLRAFASGVGDAGGDADGVRHVAAPSAVSRSTLVVLATPGVRASVAAASSDAHADALCAEARRVGREVVVIWCGHPESVPSLNAASLVIANWSASSAMLRAAGRWLVRRV